VAFSQGPSTAPLLLRPTRYGTARRAGALTPEPRAGNHRDLARRQREGKDHAEEGGALTPEPRQGTIGIWHGDREEGKDHAEEGEHQLQSRGREP